MKDLVESLAPIGTFGFVITETLENVDKTKSLDTTMNFGLCIITFSSPNKSNSYLSLLLPFQLFHKHLWPLLDY